MAARERNQPTRRPALPTPLRRLLDSRRGSGEDSGEMWRANCLSPVTEHRMSIGPAKAKMLV
eukprot:scaffold314143_cov27-Tisochrysis_lutea.AAC.1